MKLHAIRNHIIFQFVDKTDSKGQFVEETKWGLQITGSFDDSAKLPRWGTVISTGPDCADVEPGQQVLIHALKWTSWFEVDGEKMWRTDESQVAVIRPNAEAAPRVLGKNVLFKRLDSRIDKTNTGLYVVGDSGSSNTPHGKVVIAGPDCEETLEFGDIIHFSDANFFSKFVYNDMQLWYIDEQDILAVEENNSVRSDV